MGVYVMTNGLSLVGLLSAPPPVEADGQGLRGVERFRQKRQGQLYLRLPSVIYRRPVRPAADPGQASRQCRRSGIWVSGGAYSPARQTGAYRDGPLPAARTDQRVAAKTQHLFRNACVSDFLLDLRDVKQRDPASALVSLRFFPDLS